MIAKEKTECSGSTDPRILAGEKAEGQMAHYLKRAFGSSRDVFVFHDLRLVDGADEACQIDHLVVHRFGMAVIESKSVFTEVRINKELEWDCKVGRRWQGMASPVMQAQRQADHLRSILNYSRLDLRDKLFGVNKHYDLVKIEVYVAISDQGRLSGAGRKQLENVCKADQVCTRVKDSMNSLRKDSGLIGNLRAMANFEIDTPERMSLEELDRLREFLLLRHEPRGPAGRGGRYVLDVPDVPEMVDVSDLPPPLPSALPPPLPMQEEQGEACPPCPRCGAPLALRTAKKGTRVGHQFFGCSTFPMCHYTRNV